MERQEARPGFPDWFTPGITLCFFGVAVFNLLHHEMWRDELQAWMIARGSKSLSDLTANMRYEGHPPLWFALLYVITRFTSWVPAMQLLNLAIATGTAYLIAARSPFTKFQKVLLCFGYFPLYEYGTISRNYGIGVLFLFWFSSLYRPNQKHNWLVSALLLSLLANTTAYGALIAMAFAVSLFAIPAITARDTRKSLVAQGPYAWAAALSFLSCAAFAISTMLPPPDIRSAFPQAGQSWRQVVDAEFRAFLPIPRSLSHFWNTNLFIEDVAHPAPWITLGSAVILAVTLLLLARKRVALLTYAVATGFILTFMRLMFVGYERHLGHLFLIFIACLWISEQFPEKTFSYAPLERVSRLITGQRQRILTGLLSIHFAVAGAATWVDGTRPFSQGKAVAAFLRNKGMAGMFIVGDADASVSTVAGYLDRQIYYPSSQNMGSFIVWNGNRLHPRPNLIQAAMDIATRRKEEVVIVSSNPLETGASSAHEVAEFTGSIEPSENFFLYLIEPEL